MQPDTLSNSSILCLDIGSGTQDVYYRVAGREPENCPKFVLPAPARQVGARIRSISAAGRGIHLHGWNMGGGFYRDIKAHLEAGLPASAHPQAAYALSDDPARLEAMGMRLSEAPPAGHVPVFLADYDPGWWRALLAAAGLEEPEAVAACAQDHGFHSGGSNRLGRFELWRRFLAEHDGRPEELLFESAPPELTRLRALQAQIGGGPVCDTGAAAVLGLLAEPVISARSHAQGLTIVNAGNSHIIAFLVHRERILGVYEHHTGVLPAEALEAELAAFRTGQLSSRQVFDGYGHGCMTLELPADAGDFSPTYIIGPRRGMLRDMPAEFPNPGGDMMLAGCFGLLHGLRLRTQRKA